MNEAPETRRRSIRLKGYDYSQPGAYFVTICVHDRKCLLGTISDEHTTPSPFGAILQASWDDLPGHYLGLQLDASVVMPNHLHGILLLSHPHFVGAGLKPAPTVQCHALTEIVRGFKTFSARRINELCGTPRARLWQRNYFERVIRNEDELNRIRRYIAGNPLLWMLDRENPEAAGAGLKPAPTGAADDVRDLFGGVRP